MPNRRATVIPQPPPGARTVFKGSATPMYVGKGNISAHCGNCLTVLVKNAKPGQVVNIVFKCPKCGCYNDTAKILW